MELEKLINYRKNISLKVNEINTLAEFSYDEMQLVIELNAELLDELIEEKKSKITQKNTL
ncbi:MAG: hypothetical protein ACLGGV_08210 [Bacteroidia bacterium]